MGILTGFRAVDGELWTEMVDSDEARFTAFLDYLNGWAEASAADLPETTQIPRMSLDKGFEDIEHLLKAVTETEYDAYKRYRYNSDTYQKAYAFYWYEDEALIILRSHLELCQTIFERDWLLMEVKSRMFTPTLKLLTHSALDESLTMLEAEIVKRVKEREIYSELFDSPFTPASAEYTYSHYSNFLKFLMENLVMPDGEAKRLVIIGLQW
jgi:hypothetical protein